METRMVLWVALCSAFLLGLGGTMKQSPAYYRAQLQHIDLSDGVSKEEAIIIAQNNLIDDGTDKSCVLSRPYVGNSSFTMDGEGRPLAPCWAVSFDATLKMRLKSGLKWFTVHIDKATGQVKVAGWGPS